MAFTNGRRARAIGLTATLFLAGCGTSASPDSNALVPVRAALDPAHAAGRYIKHVVIIVQENRSFENLFAGWPGADAPMFGYTSNGTRVALRQSNWTGPDIGHGWPDAMLAWNKGQMNGFDQESKYSGPPSGTYPYAYLDRTLIAPYRAMANRYVLADRMFATEFGGSFTAHLDLIAGTTNLTPSDAEVEWPPSPIWGCDAPPGTWSSLVNAQRQINWTGGPFPCFTQFATIADKLDAARISWRYYAVAIGAGGDGWSSFDAIRRVRYGPDWKKIVSPPTRVLTDVANGTLAGVTWVTPEVPDSDHPGTNSGKGPAWVASVVNTIGQSKYWNSTAIVVLWDDWGGWYDDAPPPQLDFVGLGLRVPCIIISPYAREHYVSHTQYEFGSILKFAEQVFDLPSVGARLNGYTDARANSLVDSFDFDQTPRAFKSIPASLPTSYFVRQAESHEPPDTQ